MCLLFYKKSLITLMNTCSWLGLSAKLQVNHWSQATGFFYQNRILKKIGICGVQSDDKPDFLIELYEQTPV